MAELKIGGSDVKIMYGSQEIGGATKLEPGTILYIGGPDVSINSDKLYEPNVTVEITFPNVGKHWEGLKKIRIYYKRSGQVMDNGQVFDINSIDKKTESNSGSLTISRERSLTDKADKLIVKTGKNYSDLVMIAVA